MSCPAHPVWRGVRGFRYGHGRGHGNGIGLGLGHGAYQADGDPNNVTIHHHFDSMDAAKAFMASPVLAERMEEAGVQGPPTFWYATRV